MATVPDNYLTDPLTDVPPRRAPVPAGHVIVSGLTADGIPTAFVVPKTKARRYHRYVAEHRLHTAIRQRLAYIVDDPTTNDHPERIAEREVLLAYANARTHRSGTPAPRTRKDHP